MISYMIRWWTKSCTTKDDDIPIIYRFLTIPGGAGFRPSTVLFRWIKCQFEIWRGKNLAKHWLWIWLLRPMLKPHVAVATLNGSKLEKVHKFNHKSEIFDRDLEYLTRPCFWLLWLCCNETLFWNAKCFTYCDFLVLWTFCHKRVSQTFGSSCTIFSFSWPCKPRTFLRWIPWLRILIFYLPLVSVATDWHFSCRF